MASNFELAIEYVDNSDYVQLTQSYLVTEIYDQLNNNINYETDTDYFTAYIESSNRIIKNDDTTDELSFTYLCTLINIYNICNSYHGTSMKKSNKSFTKMIGPLKKKISKMYDKYLSID